MLHYDFEESVGCWVVTTAHALKRALDAELVREGITMRQWEVLACIAMKGELSQSELAERLGIEAPTLAGVLARMERDGWLERFSCPDDRRRKRIRPTAKAEGVWNRCVKCCRRVRDTATDGLTPEDLADLKRICARMRDNLAGTVAETAMACETVAGDLGAELPPQLERRSDGSITIRGHRVRLKRVLEILFSVEEPPSADEWRSKLPTVPAKTLEDVVAYCRQHEPAMRAYLDRESEIAEQHRRLHGTDSSPSELRHRRLGATT